MSHPLDGCRLKLARADAHFKALEARVRTLIDPETDRIPREFDVQRGEDVFRAQRSADVPADLSAIAGDVVHNLSATLDYLVWALVGGGTDEGGKGTNRTAFPIYTGPDAYRSGARDKIRGVPRDAQALIERLQPFERSYLPEEDPLALLYALEQRDKHRTLNLMAFGATARLWEGDDFADDLGPIDVVIGPHEYGAVIGRAPRGVLNPDVNVYLHMTYCVVFHGGWPIGHEDILVLLNRIRADVRSIPPMFSRFF
jgi:hypothetical protein